MDKVTLTLTNEQCRILANALADFIREAERCGLVEMKLEGEELRDEILAKQREIQEGHG